MHVISSYRGNRPTNKHTHKHTHKPTDRTDYNTLCRGFASAQCSNDDDDDDDEYICNTQFKQSANAPPLYYRAGVVLSYYANIWMDDISLIFVR